MSKENLFSQYSLSPRKLVKSLIRARDNWRKRSNEKQEKLLKQKMELRDVRRSRDKWKEDAKKMKQKLAESMKENELLKQTLAEKKRSLNR